MFVEAHANLAVEQCLDRFQIAQEIRRFLHRDIAFGDKPEHALVEAADVVGVLACEGFEKRPAPCLEHPHESAGLHPSFSRMQRSLPTGF